MRRNALIVFGLISIFAFVCLLSPESALAGSPTVDVCSGGDACNSFIDKYINPFIILFSALVGIAAVVSIIMAGVQYASSADDPGAVTKAKQRIFNTIIGLVAYIFLFAFLNYLVPGGIL